MRCWGFTCFFVVQLTLLMYRSQMTSPVQRRSRKVHLRWPGRSGSTGSDRSESKSDGSEKPCHGGRGSTARTKRADAENGMHGHSVSHYGAPHCTVHNADAEAGQAVVICLLLSHALGRSVLLCAPARGRMFVWALRRRNSRCFSAMRTAPS